MYCILAQQGPVCTIQQLLSALVIAHDCGINLPRPTPVMWKAVAVGKAQKRLQVAPTRPIVPTQWLTTASTRACDPLYAPLWLMLGCALRGGELPLIQANQ